MIQKKRWLTGVLAAVLAFVMLSSVVYCSVCHHLRADGTFDALPSTKDCAVCHYITACEHLLKSFGMASAAAVIPLAVTSIMHRVILLCSEFVCTFTLVSLKVKLSN